MDTTREVTSSPGGDEIVVDDQPQQVENLQADLTLVQITDPEPRVKIQFDGLAKVYYLRRDILRRESGFFQGLLGPDSELERVDEVAWRAVKRALSDPHSSRRVHLAALMQDTYFNDRRDKLHKEIELLLKIGHVCDMYGFTRFFDQVTDLLLRHWKLLISLFSNSQWNHPNVRRAELERIIKRYIEFVIETFGKFPVRWRPVMAAIVEEYLLREREPPRSVLGYIRQVDSEMLAALMAIVLERMLVWT